MDPGRPSLLRRGTHLEFNYLDNRLWRTLRLPFIHRIENLLSAKEKPNKYNT